jgi:hypothetical protein
VKVSLAFDEAGTLLQHTSNSKQDWAERGMQVRGGGRLHGNIRQQCGGKVHANLLCSKNHRV